MINVTRIKPLPLWTVMLYLFLSVLLLSQLLFAAFATHLIFSRINTSQKSLLNSSITIHWQEYNLFFSMEEGALHILAQEARTISHLDDISSGMQMTLPTLGEGGFRLLVDNHGQLMGSDVQTAGTGKALLALLAPSWERGEAFSSWELLSMEDCREFLPPHLARQAAIRLPSEDGAEQQKFSPVLVQIVAVPVFGQGRLMGCLAGVRIINNDKSAHARYRTLIPESMYSIVVDGVRISTNLTTENGVNLGGTPASPESAVTLQKNARYLGQSHMSSEELHLIISDPILNREGTVIGSLVVGIPAQTVNIIKKEILLLLSLSLLLCLGFGAIITLCMARLVTRPITALGNLVKDISRQAAISEAHLHKLDEQAPSLIVENHQLLQGFHIMAVMLYQKNLELQKINISLENTILERTLALRSAVEDLHNLSNKKSQAIVNLSHELRTPLTSIIGFSELLDDELFGKLNQTQKEYVAIIHNSATHLLELINALLDLNSIERGKLELYPQLVFMDELVQSVVETIQIQADDKGLALTLRAEPLALALDPLRMRQVLYNIITNAIKFTPSGGRINILAQRENNEAVISVQDTGIGVAGEDQKHIFDEFYQCGDLYKRRFEGIGVGLSLSRKLVCMHGGRIEFLSSPGKGTTVLINLPLDAALIFQREALPDGSS